TEAAHAHRQLSFLKKALVEAQSAAAQANTTGAELQAKYNELQSEFQALRRQLDAVIGSMTWRITAPLRTVAARLPAPLRLGMRRTVKLGWWLVTPWAIRQRLKSLRERRAPSAELSLLRASNLFDAEWYVRTYPDIAAVGIDPAVHYLSSGAAEGRDPGPHFSTQGYVQRYLDVAATGANPLLHYLEHGISEGRDISPMMELPQPLTELELIVTSKFFDREWYLKNYPDVAEAGVDPAAHYLLSGAAEERDPGPRFCTYAYLQRYPDVGESGMNPLLHYLRHGANEERDISPLEEPKGVSDVESITTSEFFDRDWYLCNYPDVAAAGNY